MLRKKKTRRPAPNAKRGGASARRLGEIGEALDIMLPELSARIAALEHLLIGKGICRREELIRSREFVQVP